MCQSLSHVQLFEGLLCPWNSPGKNTGVGCCFLLQGIFLTKGSNPCFLHWQAGSSPLSHQGSSSTVIRIGKGFKSGTYKKQNPRMTTTRNICFKNSVIFYKQLELNKHMRLLVTFTMCSAFMRFHISHCQGRQIHTLTYC